jgi:membrane-associated phospholipid phosphatase
MYRAYLLAFALAASAVREATSQSVAQIVGSDVKNAALDFVSIWTSPFRGTWRDYAIVGGVLAAGAAVSPLDDEVDRWAIRNRDRGVLDAIRPFRRGGDFYSINELGPYVAGLYVVGAAINHEGIRDGIFGCASAYLANTTIRHQVLYRVIGRDRPEVLKDPGTTPTPPAEHGDQYDFRIPAKGWGQHTFPGGHVATMAVCASFLSHRFDLGFVEPVLVGLVTVMGVGRLADRGHWLSDQVVGVAYGFAIGREVAHRQLKRRARVANGESSVEVGERGASGSPYVGSDGNGTRLGWQVRF